MAIASATGCDGEASEAAVCGDGARQGAEECDDGNVLSGDGCSAQCAVEICGDGVVHKTLGEVCDDGNFDSGDGCSSSCQPEAFCGDGDLGDDEDCDDGNKRSGGGCSASCEVEPFCGDGHEDPGEDCDDGNTDSEDGCSAACAVEDCGDGVVQKAMGEVCDDGDATEAPCTADCQPAATCGDGQDDPGEECDDGGNVDGDGCSAGCLEEVCGDGVRQASLGEECDDGNDALGDGCTPECVAELQAGPADAVVDAPGATGEGYGDPNHAVNGVFGGGTNTGSTDVYSIRLEPPRDRLVLRWSGARVLNGPGVDFVVFENAFAISGGDGGVFMDPTVVEVSRDGATWVPFPHDYVASDETAYSTSPLDWLGFAGRTPVRYHEQLNPVDPFDAAEAGGDGFDLDDLPSDEPEAQAIREGGFVFLRLVGAGARVNPDTGAPFVTDPITDGPDIDGVYGRYLVPEDVR